MLIKSYSNPKNAGYIALEGCVDFQIYSFIVYIPCLCIDVAYAQNVVLFISQRKLPSRFVIIYRS